MSQHCQDFLVVAANLLGFLLVIRCFFHWFLLVWVLETVNRSFNSICGGGGILHFPRPIYTSSINMQQPQLLDSKSEELVQLEGLQNHLGKLSNVSRTGMSHTPLLLEVVEVKVMLKRTRTVSL